MSDKKYYLPWEFKEEEAIQFRGNFDEIEKFVGGDAECRNGELIVATRDGALHAKNFDYIVKTKDGKFIACSPEEWNRRAEQ